MHQGSVLSPLLFVIVVEAISREFRVALPWELLYADDLAMIGETEEELIKRLNEWKDNVESNGMRVNMNKTKVMISGERQMVRQKAVKWPCGVCSKGVGSNSIQCSSCQKWVDSVVSVERHSERVLVLKMVLGTVTTTTVYDRLTAFDPGQPG